MRARDRHAGVRGEPGRSCGSGPTNTFVPFLIAEAPLGDWALGLDVVGNTCVVGTDGSGVAIFDVTAGNPTPQGNEKHALRVFNVRLAGNRVYGAAGADGIVVIDISDRDEAEAGFGRRRRGAPATT